jgi:hypothetical protein
VDNGCNAHSLLRQEFITTFTPEQMASLSVSFGVSRRSASGCTTSAASPELAPPLLSGSNGTTPGVLISHSAIAARVSSARFNPNSWLDSRGALQKFDAVQLKKRSFEDMHVVYQIEKRRKNDTVIDRRMNLRSRAPLILIPTLWLRIISMGLPEDEALREEVITLLKRKVGELTMDLDIWREAAGRPRPPKTR